MAQLEIWLELTCRISYHPVLKQFGLALSKSFQIKVDCWNSWRLEKLNSWLASSLSYSRGREIWLNLCPRHQPSFPPQRRNGATILQSGGWEKIWDPNQNNHKII